MATRADIEAEAKRLGEEYAAVRERGRALRKQIGPVIVALAQAGATQGEIAEMTGLTRLTVHRYEAAGGIVRQQRPWTATITGVDAIEPVTAVSIEDQS